MSCAIVTGSSRGIGRAIAVELANMGHNIVVNYSGNEEMAKETKEQLEKIGVSAIMFHGDVSDFEKSKEMIDMAVNTFGSVDVLVNNAGVTRDTLLMRMKEEDFERVIDINLKGTFNCCKHAIKYMNKQRSGKIINIASVVGEIGNVGQCNYAASKAGIIGFTKSLAKEVAKRNVNVNAVAPGFIETDMTKVLSDDIRESLLNSIPMNGFGEPSDVAKAVGFLASENAKYITGQVLNVCGGMVM